MAEDCTLLVECYYLPMSQRQPIILLLVQIAMLTCESGIFVVVGKVLLISEPCSLFTDFDITSKEMRSVYKISKNLGEVSLKYLFNNINDVGIVAFSLGQYGKDHTRVCLCSFSEFMK